LRPSVKQRKAGSTLQSAQVTACTFCSTFSGSSNEESQASGNASDVINVFSLASGHLYERLMRIMMLSVMSKTRSKVKFWVLKNYLSPQFKVSNRIKPRFNKYNLQIKKVNFKV